MWHSRASRAVLYVYLLCCVFCCAKLTAQMHVSNCGLNFQTHTDSLSDGQKVGPKHLVQHLHANKHWQCWACTVIFHIAHIYLRGDRHATHDINLQQRDTPAPRMFKIHPWRRINQRSIRFRKPMNPWIRMNPRWIRFRKPMNPWIRNIWWK